MGSVGEAPAARRKRGWGDTSKINRRRAMPETTEEKVQKAKEAERKLEGELEKHGFNSFWAKLVAGAVIAAIAVAVGMFTTQCTMTYTKLPDGTVRAHGNVVLPQKVHSVTK